MGGTQTTGEVAAEIGTTEARLQELIRYGKITPLPPKKGRRRAWGPKHKEAAKVALERNS